MPVKSQLFGEQLHGHIVVNHNDCEFAVGLHIESQFGSRNSVRIWFWYTLIRRLMRVNLPYNAPLRYRILAEQIVWWQCVEITRPFVGSSYAVCI